MELNAFNAEFFMAQRHPFMRLLLPLLLYLLSERQLVLQQHMPVVLYWHDSFKKPYPCQPDVIVPIDDTLEELVQMACCHESQYFDWMYWPDHTERIDWPKEQKVAHLRDRFDRLFADHRRQYDSQVRAKFGAEADGIGHVEVYEISEYGEEPSQAFMDMLER